MKKGFKPMSGSDGWQLSNANVLSMASQKASLKIFSEAGIDRIRTKSLLLTGFLEFLLRDLSAEKGRFSIITPHDTGQRGAQLSLLFQKNGRDIYQRLKEKGVIVDWREPGSIRIAPAPLYNSYLEVFRFSQILKNLLN
jgi:kynureninase